MDVKQKYIKEAGFDIDEGFVESIQKVDIRTGIKIAQFIQKNVDTIHPNTYVSTILEGLIINDDKEPVTFVVEIIKDHSPYTVLSDLQLISMDEYLDLINLKSNGSTQSRRGKKHS
jgi:hypothetical protein